LNDFFFPDFLEFFPLLLGKLEQGSQGSAKCVNVLKSMDSKSSFTVSVEHDGILLDLPPTPEIPLPKGWSDLTLQAVLHIIFSLTRIAILNIRKLA